MSYSAPVTAVEGAVLDGFGDVRDGERGLSFEVGDGTGDFKDAVVGAGGEALLLHGAFEKLLGVRAQLAEGANLAGAHLCVGIDLFFCAGEPLALQLACIKDASADAGRAFAGSSSAQLAVLDSGDFDVDVDAVQERSGDFGDVALDERRGAVAFARFVVEVAARARVISLLPLPSCICRCGVTSEGFP
jgi:hypothetical protein